MELRVDPKSIAYLIVFLFGEDGSARVAYTDAAPETVSQPVIIRPSGFFAPGVFGTAATMPALPLEQWHGVPLLFGRPAERWEQGKLIVEADIIASVFFLVSRYEERINPARDAHGRFPGKVSLPYRAGFLDRPIAEEYAAVLVEIAAAHGIPFERRRAGFDHIWLTHDVDVPWESFTLKSALRRVGGILKREHRLRLFPILNALGFPERDPRYTFPAMQALDARLPAATPVFFFKSGGTAKPQDAFVYIRSRAARRLIRRLRRGGALLGYHASFSAGADPAQIAQELKTLRAVSGDAITCNRNHYLNSRAPQDFHALIRNGITDDFTMGYADVAGFRLGTCRAVRWIDPENGELTSLLLHPLTIMEATLSGAQYMALDEQGMRDVSKTLVDAVWRFHGELTLLWHNQSVMAGNVNRAVYVELLSYLAQLTTDQAKDV